jgi:hypothetical protein
MEKQQLKDLLGLLSEMETEEAPCNQDPEAFYCDPTNLEAVAVAKTICKTCPYRSQCAAYAIRWEQLGIWGGLTPQERKLLRF